MVDAKKAIIDEALLAETREYLSETDMELVARAYNFSEVAHTGQFRLSGEPFFQHPLHTALFLAELRLDASALAAALLHDVLEDCSVSYEKLKAEFGTEVAGLVHGVTKLTRTEQLSEDFTIQRSDESDDDDIAGAETLRKMLVAMAEDVRVVLIKLADRLHNMKTAKALPISRRITMAKETLEIYAPLSHRLGIWEIKWRLEDLAFQHLDPSSYRYISTLLNSKRTEREQYVERIRGALQSELAAAGLTAEVTGRPKHIYSIHKKRERYARMNKEVGHIYDLFALRVLVEETKDCYAALGVIHNSWRPLPGQFDDYIANPKDNLYKSIHTAVLCEDAMPVEVQIRTQAMHRVAEFGIAAHWVYKEGDTVDIEFDRKMTWLRQLLDWQRDAGGALEFVESFKADIFQTQVFVYTPKGEIKELPIGATPLDLAYRIHTDIGHRCVGAKVNEKLVALSDTLQNGDTVEILTSHSLRGPSLEWLNPNLGYIHTRSARAKIRQWFNRQERDSNVRRGEDIFQTQLLRLDPGLLDKDLAILMGTPNTIDLFASLGDGTLTVYQIVQKLSQQEIVVDHNSQAKMPSIGPASGVEVLGVGDLPTTMARCCNPAGGDNIVGVIVRGTGVAIHRAGCLQIVGEEKDVERMVTVHWGVSQTLYPVRIQIEAWDRVGLLGDLTSTVSKEGINIANCVSEEYDDRSVISLTVYTRGIGPLSKLFSRLEAVKGVMVVSRPSE